MHGGKRIGAGRKKGFAAKNAEEARKLLSERVAQEIGPISDALISKAKEGNIQAIKELFDRSWGRAPQSKTAEAAEPIILNVVSYAGDIVSEVAPEPIGATVNKTIE